MCEALHCVNFWVHATLNFYLEYDDGDGTSVVNVLAMQKPLIEIQSMNFDIHGQKKSCV